MRIPYYTIVDKPEDIAKIFKYLHLSRIVLVIDIPSAYLPEVGVKERLIQQLIEALSSLPLKASLFVNPYIGTYEEAMENIPWLKRYHSQGMLLNIEDITIIRLSIYSQGLKKRHTIKIYDLNSVGLPVILSTPRTSDILPLFLSIPQYVQYILAEKVYHLLFQGPLATHLNIAKIFLACPAQLAIIPLDTIVHGDGPIYGYVDTIAKLNDIFIVGLPPIVDTIVAQGLKVKLEYLDYLDIVCSYLDLDCKSFATPIHLYRYVKFRYHSLTNDIIQTKERFKIKGLDKNYLSLGNEDL